jgi:cytochrome c5
MKCLLIQLVLVFQMTLLLASCGDQDAVADAKPTAVEPEPSAASTAWSDARNVRDFDLRHGEAVFTATCLSCHGKAVDKAPVLGKASDWEARLTQDLNTLIQHAVAGHGRMPPKGGFSELTDAEVAAAVAYTVNESRRVIASLKKTQNSDECHPFKSPEKCSKSELREVLTLHMLWLLGATKGEQ